MATTGTVRFEQTDYLATVFLDNEEKLNAINLAMWQSLRSVFTRLSDDGSIRCIVVRGAGERAFAAGGDLEEFVSHRATLEQALHYHGEVASALQAIAACPHPTVARLRGPCIGGGLEIAAACDLRLCDNSARFGAPINRLGFSMYPGEMEGLLTLVGPAVLKEILLEGRILSAEEALIKGLVTRKVADDGLDAEVLSTAARIAAGAPLVAGWHKRWIRRLGTGQPLGASELAESFAFLETDDYREGLRAFLEKRPPQFTGR